MLDETRAHRRLFLLLTVVAVAVLVSGGFAWRSTAFPTPMAPPLVRVTETLWSVEGCTASNSTGPGFVTAQSTVVSVNGTVGNLDPSAACVISGFAVGAGGFAIVNYSVPRELAPFGSAGANASVRAELSAPAGWHTTALDLILIGSPGA